VDEASARAVGERHPKFAHYPHQRDYGFRSQDFRPFVTFVNPPNYRSASVNVDGYGLRENYDADGKYIDLGRARDEYESCTVLLGGSVAFGVGASSDRDTLAARLTEPGRPCLNFGVRAVGCRQELAVFLALRHLLPPVNAVVIFSGINECILAGSDRVALYPGYGAVFAEHVQALGAPAGGGGGEAASGAPRAVHTALDRLARRGRALQKKAAPAAAPVARTDAPELDFDERLTELMTLLGDTIETWSWIQRGLDVPITYVLQPVVPWTGKVLGPVEQECYDADVATVPAIARLAPAEIHDRLRATLEDACVRYGVGFHDANRWFADGRYDHLEYFFDVAHLTDAGNAAIADRLREELTCFHA
jgi:hypothetical protein